MTVRVLLLQVLRGAACQIACGTGRLGQDGQGRGYGQAKALLQAPAEHCARLRPHAPKGCIWYAKSSSLYSASSQWVGKPDVVLGCVLMPSSA